MLVNKDHPDLYAFLTQIQKEQQDTETCLVELSLGRSVKAAPKKQWVALQRRFLRISEEYQKYKDENRTLEYLKTISHNILLS